MEPDSLDDGRCGQRPERPNSNVRPNHPCRTIIEFENHDATIHAGKAGATIDPVFVIAATNATLNAISAVVIARAYRQIRAGDVAGHRRGMLLAAGLQAVFLILYLTKSVLYGTTPFEGQAAIRLIYLVILGAHSLAASVTAPLVLVALVLGLRGRYDRHRRVARWAYPIWFFTSVTGPLTFVLLYGFGRPGYGVQALATGMGVQGLPEAVAAIGTTWGPFAGAGGIWTVPGLFLVRALAGIDPTLAALVRVVTWA
ncbi:DUF420 domain-containing protein [Thermaerobacter sp. PB12/4term]|uniref:DUF420 domain-containing protein n=1 Tax=Thermaerobacter sp. PB12/4term TaxID=2293838 RepID=UPI000E328466|nr:DUF420 domain-containing protein [Thermaerobacter sp. PB12/4term]QIA27912.1 DUF420 domain-containing protein [Thermaerobacter sp. PB12/4term]